MKKALIIQNKYIGDVLISSILAENLKKNYPKIQVHFFCYKNAKAVLDHNPFIDSIICFDENDLKNIITLKNTILKLRKEKYDLLLDPYAKLQSKIITFFSGSRIKIGLNKLVFPKIYHHSFHEEKVKYKYGLAIDKRLELLKPLESEQEYIYFPKIYISESDKQAMKKFLRAEGILFTKKIIFLSITGSHENKTYPLDYLSQIINSEFSNKEVDIILNYNPKNIEAKQKFISLLKPSVKKKIYTEIYAKSLKDLLAVIANTHLFIGNDGGDANFSKALGKPTFIIFSPWVMKKSWSLLEDGEKHIAVHNSDFIDNYHSIHDRKIYKKNYKKEYKKLTPEKILPIFKSFLVKNL